MSPTTGFVKRGRLIGLGGLLRAGKDAVGDYLVAEHDFVKMGMSDALNDALQKIGPKGPWIHLDYTVDYLGFSGTFVRYTDLLAVVGYVEAKKHRDVREYLQGLGTEVGREMIDPDVWVKIAKARIEKALSEGQNVVLTAVRFPNEIRMIRDLGGAPVWIHRPDSQRLEGIEASVSTPGEPQSVLEGVGSLTAHVSETSVSPDMFHWGIINDGDLKQLHEKVEATLKRIPTSTGVYSEHPAYDPDIAEQWPTYDR